LNPQGDNNDLTPPSQSFDQGNINLAHGAPTTPTLGKRNFSSLVAGETTNENIDDQKRPKIEEGQTAGNSGNGDAVGRGRSVILEVRA